MDVNDLLEYESEVPWELKKYIEWLLSGNRKTEPKTSGKGIQTPLARLIPE